MAVDICEDCGRERSPVDWTCPHCGRTSWGLILGAGVLAVVFLAYDVIQAFVAWDEYDTPTLLVLFGVVGAYTFVQSLVTALRTPKRSVDGWVAALDDDERHCREAAAAKLESLGWQPADADESGRFAVARRDRDEAARLGDAAVAPLIRALDEECARRALRQIGSAEGEGSLGDVIVAAVSDTLASQPLPAEDGDALEQAASKLRKAEALIARQGKEATLRYLIGKRFWRPFHNRRDFERLLERRDRLEAREELVRSATALVEQIKEGHEDGSERDWAEIHTLLDEIKASTLDAQKDMEEP